MAPIDKIYFSPLQLINTYFLRNTFPILYVKAACQRHIFAHTCARNHAYIRTNPRVYMREITRIYGDFRAYIRKFSCVYTGIFTRRGSVFFSY